jgi:hypothetical protein
VATTGVEEKIASAVMDKVDKFHVPLAVAAQCNMQRLFALLSSSVTRKAKDVAQGSALKTSAANTVVVAPDDDDEQTKEVDTAVRAQPAQQAKGRRVYWDDVVGTAPRDKATGTTRLQQQQEQAVEKISLQDARSTPVPPTGQPGFTPILQRWNKDVRRGDTMKGKAKTVWQQARSHTPVYEIQGLMPRWHVCRARVALLNRYGDPIHMEAVVDSGASNSVISVDAVRKLDRLDHIGNTAATFVTADGARGKARGLLKGLWVATDDLALSVDAYISGARNYTILLGTDFLGPIKATLCYDTTRLLYTNDSGERSSIPIIFTQGEEHSMVDRWGRYLFDP